MTRGLLRTIATSHPYGQQFYDGFTTPVGRIANVLKGTRGLDRYNLFDIVADGPISGMEYDEGVTEARMEITSDLLRSVRSPVGELFTEVKQRESGEIEYFLAGSNTWSWVRAGDCCLRVGRFAVQQYQHAHIRRLAALRPYHHRGKTVERRAASTVTHV